MELFISKDGFIVTTLNVRMNVPLKALTSCQHDGTQCHGQTDQEERIKRTRNWYGWFQPEAGDDRGKVIFLLYLFQSHQDQH